MDPASDEAGQGEVCLGFREFGFKFLGVWRSLAVLRCRDECSPSCQGLWIDNFDVLMAPVQERLTSVCGCRMSHRT